MDEETMKDLETPEFPPEEIEDPDVPPVEPDEPEQPTGPSVEDSILYSIKKLLGLDKDYDAFDTDVMIHINSVLMIVNQLGVEPDRMFSISGPNETWADFLGEDANKINLVKSYMFLKVKLLFDPPSTGVLHEAMERQIKEFEWRLNVQVDDDILIAYPELATEEEIDDFDEDLDNWRKSWDEKEAEFYE